VEIHVDAEPGGAKKYRMSPNVKAKEVNVDTANDQKYVFAFLFHSVIISTANSKQQMHDIARKAT
jgi:hypothetical protein